MVIRLEKEYSVLMSVYYKEHADYLKESIESMLRQTIRTNDFVIVCDGRLTKELNDVLDYYIKKEPDLFRIVRLKKRGGLGNALNKGIRYCRNDLVARMDSDDISVPERCELQLKVFANENISIAGGNITEFSENIDDGKTGRIVPCTDGEIRRFAKKRNPFNHPTVMYRKKDVLKAGNYEDYPGFEDYQLWVKMLQNGMRGYNIPEILVYMRAGNGMYGRRGGREYMKSMAKFRLYMKRVNFLTWYEFILSITVRGIGAMIPGKMREYAYKKLLRDE